MEDQVTIAIHEPPLANQSVKVKNSESMENEIVNEEAQQNNFECRICHQPDLLCLLEAPCHCNGTLKYAHRICVQRWCEAKGNIICEICRKPFRPNYSAMATPPPPASPNDGRAISPIARSPRGDGDNLLRRDEETRFTDTIDEATSIGGLLFGTGIALCLGVYLVILAIAMTAIVLG